MVRQSRAGTVERSPDELRVPGVGSHLLSSSVLVGSLKFSVVLGHVPSSQRLGAELEGASKAQSRKKSNPEPWISDG